MIWQIGLICSTTIQKILQSYALFICFFSYVVRKDSNLYRCSDMFTVNMFVFLGLPFSGQFININPS